MAKRLLLLMLILPLLLMMCLFTASNMVSLIISVPVSKIKVHEEGVVYLDLDAHQSYQIEYTVYPTNAKNKNVTFYAQQIGSEPFAQLLFENGRIIPQSSGKALVFVSTVDGGFRDSFIVQVESKETQHIECSVKNSVVKVGEIVEIITEFTPANTPNKRVSYMVLEGEECLSLTTQGKVKAIRCGNSKIKVSSIASPTIYDVVDIVVENQDLLDLAEKEIITSKNSGEIFYSLANPEGVNITAVVKDSDSQVVEDLIDLTIDTKTQTITYSFKQESFIGRATICITASGTDVITKCCQITKLTEISAEWEYSHNVALKVGETTTVAFTVIPSGADVECSITTSNNYITVQVKEGYLVIVANSVAANIEDSNTLITLTIIDKNDNTNKVVIEKTIITYSNLK